jgi:hypothetical protein
MDSEHDVPKMAIESLGDLLKEEVKSAFLHWKERYPCVADYHDDFHPN